MNQPEVQFVKTEDGVSIAYWTLGEGEPIVYMGAQPISHVDADWQHPAMRHFYEVMAQRSKVVKFDARGSGLSTRDVADCSFDARLLDLQAVVDGLGLDRFALAGMLGTTRLAIMYAIRQPERVSHLVLIDGYASGSEFQRNPQMKGLKALLETDWEMYTETVANVGYGWAAGEPARRFAAYLRQCATQEVTKAYFRVDERLDITDELSQVHTPTLVLHRRGVPFPSIDASTDMASQIPNARLALAEGTWGTMEAAETITEAIQEFLSEGEEQAAATSPTSSGFATILFTDMESSTALTQKLGDAAVQEVRRTHNEIVRAALSANRGSEIKHTGDGIMASFASASSGLECAIAIQQGVASHKEDHPDSPLAVYVGLNAGEPIAEDDDLFGTSVDLAARLVDHAQPGQIIASDVVRQLAAGKDFLFSDLGETELRGFEDPVKLWELRWQD